MKAVRRRIICSGLAAALLASPAVPGTAYAAGVETQAAGTQSVGTQSVGTQATETQAAGASKLVPVRFLLEAGGAEVKWNEDLQQAEIVKGDTTAVIRIGSDEALVNGQLVKLGDSVKMINWRTYAPLDLVSRILGRDFTWEESLGSSASSFIKLLEQGRFSEAATLFNGNLEAAISADMLKLIWNANYKPYGELKKVGSSVVINDVHQNVITSCKSIYGNIDFTVRFDRDGRIDEFSLTPSGQQGLYKTADYDKPDMYIEKEVVVGEGKWALPATLTMPKGKGPFPAVVLVHGSGACDRNEEIGALKPFKDLAAGLASKGIAVLRYEKRSREHPMKMQLEKALTIDEETIDDALLAAKLLSRTEGIDAGSIFVLGHSQGGMAMPRILRGDTDGLVKGVVIMAGPSRPLEDILVEQYKYLMTLGLANKNQVEFIEQQVALLKKPDFKPEAPPKEYMLGSPYWWYDIRNYKAAEDAKSINKPMLVLQGARDYQVTAAGDFEGWKGVLEGRSDAELKLYPKLNHCFTEGEGQMSTPQEYFMPANVAAYVIDDIALWINKIIAK